MCHNPPSPPPISVLGNGFQGQVQVPGPEAGPGDQQQWLQRPGAIWPWGNIQIPPVNIPMPTNIGPEMGGQNRFGIPFWLVSEFTTHFSQDFSGDWDGDWGYLDFDPWPHGKPKETILSRRSPDPCLGHKARSTLILRRCCLWFHGDSEMRCVFSPANRESNLWLEKTPCWPNAKLACERSTQ